ncbi:hypothetical protein BO82DRAFT_153538 [Aspergillus uvarum CBS 121591]|uniref:Uncharacterized protein n=1 Tax=Aspergillus uvarum CBS 121591 TaxID=1448315 RepID=A0A319C0R5_9EURO|nr:hypothetical protein BO82DRAFT_153538 [Aspergillus uvarum CBS 121591]PYH78635.1 hypothetical protein BO82DRAFT_153538 [Aspergillus uvarum CBS 121591]
MGTDYADDLDPRPGTTKSELYQCVESGCVPYRHVPIHQVLQNWAERVREGDWAVDENGVSGGIGKWREADTEEACRWGFIRIDVSVNLLHLQPDRHLTLPVFYRHYPQFAALYDQDLTQPPSDTTANLMHSNAFLMNVLVVADLSSTRSTSWVTRTGQEDIDQAFSWIRGQAIHQSILHRKDEVALLLFAIWLREMQELDLWWMRDRARNECRSICGMLPAQ